MEKQLKELNRRISNLQDVIKTKNNPKKGIIKTLENFIENLKDGIYEGETKKKIKLKIQEIEKW